METADEQLRVSIPRSPVSPSEGERPPWSARAIAGRRSSAEIESLLGEAVAHNRVITLVTYYLSDYGESVMNAITTYLLGRFQRPDLNDVVYTCLKELVVNAGKANLKRIVFAESGLDPNSPGDYDRGMLAFKRNLPERRIRSYRAKFRQYNLPVVITFYYEPFRALKVKIKNACPLWPSEEERIRARFRHAREYRDLMQFYLAHGDETEGAGMGMALVGILLDQLGIDRHSFSIYSSERYNETIARLEIPLSSDYESRRARFEREWRASGLDKETFRASFV